MQRALNWPFTCSVPPVLICRLEIPGGPFQQGAAGDVPDSVRRKFCDVSSVQTNGLEDSYFVF